MTRTRGWAAALITPLLALTMAAGGPFPSSIPLPDDFAPEGIAVGKGARFYVGSLHDGDIYAGNLRTGRGRILVDTDVGPAAGMKVDVRRHRLFVAAAFTGKALVYDTRTGRPLAQIVLGEPGTTFLNDVVITRRAAWFTDTFAPRIYRVPIAPDGSLGTPRTIPVTGPAAPIVDGFGLNGIDAAPSGKKLIAAHTGLDQLFTLDRRTGRSRLIRIPGTPLPPSIDGILLDGRTVWVVSNFSNVVSKIRLGHGLKRGRIVDTLTNDDVGGLFRVPTTVAEHGNRLVLVNARFDLGLPPPFGEGAPAGTDYDVVQVPKP
jgi:sugar lactone lactonase YvrE